MKDYDYIAQSETKTLTTLTKYYNDGTIKMWLSNEDNEELYLIKEYKHPSGKSPVQELKPFKTTG
jgi:hypothetical protein